MKLLIFFLIFILPIGTAHGESFSEAKAQYLSLRNADSKIKKVTERERLAHEFLAIAEDDHRVDSERELSLVNAAILFAECARVDKNFLYQKKSRDSLQALEVNFPQSAIIDDGYIAVASIYGGDVKKEIFAYVLEHYPESDGALLIKSTRVQKEENVIHPRCSVLLDPGHGGEDFGAQGGTTGVLEKDIALDIAKKTSMLLEQRQIKVFFTRSTDIFLPLETRGQLAQEISPDAFLSLHVNFEPSKKVSGLEMYILNTESSEASIKLASRENQGATPPDDASIVLSKSVQDELSKPSKIFAHNLKEKILSERKSAGFDSKDLGIKEALFYVLVGVRAPSVLLELGFLSSEEELLFLNDSYIASTAEGIARGIEKFCDDITKS